MTISYIKNMILDLILYIYNLICFEKSNNNIKTYINTSNEFNAMTFVYA